MLRWVRLGPALRSLDGGCQSLCQGFPSPCALLIPAIPSFRESLDALGFVWSDRAREALVTRYDGFLPFSQTAVIPSSSTKPGAEAPWKDACLKAETRQQAA